MALEKMYGYAEKSSLSTGDQTYLLEFPHSAGEYVRTPASVLGILGVDFSEGLIAVLTASVDPHSPTLVFGKNVTDLAFTGDYILKTVEPTAKD